MIDGDSPRPDPKKTLLGKTVLVTRPAGQAGDLTTQIEALGGRVILHPVIKIGPPESAEPLIRVVKRLAEFVAVVFASRNGVRFFQSCIQALDQPMPGTIQAVAIGSSTQSLVFETLGLRALVPPESDSAGLAEFLVDRFASQRLLLVRGNRGSDVLQNQLAASGMQFETVVVYQSRDIAQADPKVIELLKSNQIDWITATSSSIGRAAVRLFGPWTASKCGDETRQAKLVSISPTTSAAIGKAGGDVFAEAKTFNVTGIVEALVAYDRSLG